MRNYRHHSYSSEPVLPCTLFQEQLTEDSAKHSWTGNPRAFMRAHASRKHLLSHCTSIIIRITAARSCFHRHLPAFPYILPVSPENGSPSNRSSAPSGYRPEATVSTGSTEVCMRRSYSPPEPTYRGVKQD